METNQTPAMLPIFTTEPKAEAGKQVVFFRRKKVAESESYRAVLVPSYKLPSACYIEGEGDETTVQDAEEVFRIALADAFMDSASSILRRFCDEKRDAKQEAKEIPADMLTFSAVVTEMVTQQTSQRLNGDDIAAWYDASTTNKEAISRYGNEEKGKRQQAALRAKFLSLASNNPAIMPDLAVKMLAYISPDDTENSVCKAVAKRLERLSQVSVSADEL